MTTQAPRPRYETNFTKMVDEDIQNCERYLAGARDKKTGEELHYELVAKYPPYIAHFGDFLQKFNHQYGFVRMEYYDCDALTHDLIVMKSRLVAFKNRGYRNVNIPVNDSGRNMINLAAAQEADDISFEAVRQKIREMTGLAKAKAADAFEKVDAIEEIARSNESKKAKWEKVKPIMFWLADESVELGIMMLPLFMEIVE